MMDFGKIAATGESLAKAADTIQTSLVDIVELLRRIDKGQDRIIELLETLPAEPNETHTDLLSRIERNTNTTAYNTRP